ncbi:MAG: hypothetical protein NW224_16810 [Leptolyngbyaceae cyanobacterium bins.302]|nr:hypothetical protein [Leptolyngbyaceae cyanobacterium bins.302]
MLNFLFGSFIISIIPILAIVIFLRRLNRRAEAGRSPKDQAEYDFGVELGELLGKEEYLPAFEKAKNLYKDGAISKLKVEMDLALGVCNKTIEEITPGTNFSSESFEDHVRAAARVTAYYAMIQIFLRHPSVNMERIVEKLGKEFYESLMEAVGNALSLKHVQNCIDAWNVLKLIDETGNEIENKVRNMKR